MQNSFSASGGFFEIPNLLQNDKLLVKMPQIPAI